jgi:hypothetical protein
MSNHGWIITKDIIEDGKCNGTMGPSNIAPEISDRLKKGEGTKFRLFDDDGELYAEGLQIEGDSDGFGPLDDFGMPNWGCTDLKQFINGKWETL